MRQLQFHRLLEFHRTKEKNAMKTNTLVLVSICLSVLSFIVGAEEATLKTEQKAFFQEFEKLRHYGIVPQKDKALSQQNYSAVIERSIRQIRRILQSSYLPSDDAKISSKLLLLPSDGKERKEDLVLYPLKMDNSDCLIVQSYDDIWIFAPNTGKIPIANEDDVVSIVDTVMKKYINEKAYKLIPKLKYTRLKDSNVYFGEQPPPYIKSEKRRFINTYLTNNDICAVFQQDSFNDKDFSAGRPPLDEWFKRCSDDRPRLDPPKKVIPPRPSLCLLEIYVRKKQGEEIFCKLAVSHDGKTVDNQYAKLGEKFGDFYTITDIKYDEANKKYIVSVLDKRGEKTTTFECSRIMDHFTVP
jgi:hypothetical protein